MFRTDFWRLPMPFRMVDLFNGHHWITAQLANLTRVAECCSAVQLNKRASATGTRNLCFRRRGC